MLAAGSKAPKFESLDERLQNGPVLVAIYKISCPVCQLTLPFLSRIANGGLQILAISQDDGAATNRFEARFGVSLPTVLDREEERYPIGNAFGITHVPSLFLIEPDGVISMTSEGFVKADLEAIAARAGAPIFRVDESVPAWKAG
jgi:peroxiredoxin